MLRCGKPWKKVSPFVLLSVTSPPDSPPSLLLPCPARVVYSAPPLAGVRGTITRFVITIPSPSATYHFYELDVKTLDQDWLERNERKREWVDYAEAIRRLEWKAELSQGLKLSSLAPSRFVAVVAAEKYNWLGNLSPYHKAPVPCGVSKMLPEDCTVVQVMLMGWHGSRWPLQSELVYITNLTDKLTATMEYILNNELPENLQFLKDGHVTTLGHDNLTASRVVRSWCQVRTLVPFDHVRHPTICCSGIWRLPAYLLVIKTGNIQVVESAQWFSQGYFGREWAELKSRVFSTIPEDEVTISWITPMDTCAKWAYSYGGDAVETWDSAYLPAITERLNTLLPGVNLTDADTHGALYACVYDCAALRLSPWFIEIRYELDILMDGAFGYNLPGNMGPFLGTIFVNKLIERSVVESATTEPADSFLSLYRFSDSTGNASAVYLEFGHDTTIDTAFAALGLAKDTPPLSATGPVPPNRAFRTSTQVPFGAQMVWEKFTCTSSFNGPQIRLIMNDSPFPLSACAGTEQDGAYGSCSFDKFVDSNALSTSLNLSAKGNSEEPVFFDK
ncbi:phosphoglycerate mutase-like protein [Guyanagaster necrorhizus]|uniref:Phosphoglycerate mutase-like protein n=1 Tax=Guyanagaster necrorhizus TaxID=856835 RepID=A0A9P8AXE9_9AGAR|nr:phosphoglycerate mutase-like protein [Guyanagaster necrorhizus MCA 3950]KAG7451310.1 phosphoglycerate mutase-like protein [Guyanagaster necrorhizus MCA 3950]